MDPTVRGRLRWVPFQSEGWVTFQPAATVDEVLAQRIKHLIDAEPYLGCRMAWARLRRQGLAVNRKAVQRIMQPKGWQCHRWLKKRCSPRVQSSPSVAVASNARWVRDATYVWTRFDGLVYVNAVMDCADRECIGLNVSQRNDAREGPRRRADPPLRRFTARRRRGRTTHRQRARLCFGAILRAGQVLRLHQEFILPHTLEQNGVAESFMGTLKLECVGRHRWRPTTKRRRRSPPGSCTTTSRGHIRGLTISCRQNGAAGRAN